MRPAVQTEKDLSGARDAAGLVVETHRALSGFLRHGQTLAEIDAFVGRTLDKLGATSCFFKYNPGRMPPFPSQACLSVNECVVHGTAGYLTRPMEAGDLLKVDVGVKYRGWIGDAAWTYSFGEPSDENRRLMESGKESLRKGVQQLRPGNTFLEWARAVQKVVEEDYGFHLIRGLGGHGYGRSLHAAPWISNVVPTFPGEWPDANLRCEPGMLVAVEPMIAVGTGETRQGRKQWPIFSADGSMSVHYEHDVLISENGPVVLTAGLEEIEDVITR